MITLRSLLDQGVLLKVAIALGTCSTSYTCVELSASTGGCSGKNPYFTLREQPAICVGLRFAADYRTLPMLRLMDNQSCAGGDDISSGVARSYSLAAIR